MKKLRVKISVSNEGKSKKYVTFSFDKMLNEGNYSFEFFKKNKRDHIQAYQDLLNRFQELSRFAVLDLMSLDKKQGYELINVSELKANIQNHLEKNGITKDSKVAIFRFSSSQKYRIVCHMVDNVFHVLAFDFDHSAYNHGS